MDISQRINASNKYTATTPSCGQMTKPPNKPYVSSVETIQQAKANEFPVMPLKKKTQK